MSAPADGAAGTRSTDPTTDLHLLSVLEPGLPPELGTPHEPAAYTVPLVFSRRVSAQERRRIESPEQAARLTRAVGAAGGGPGLRLTVSDRRLLVEGTTLAQLRDGLAAELAAMLRDIGRELRAEQSERDVAAGVSAAQEARRASAVREVVSAIRFE